MVLRIPLAAFRFQIRGFHPLWLAFPKPFFYLLWNHRSLAHFFAVHYPGMHAFRFRLFPFRSPLLWKSMFLSLERFFSFFSSGYLDVSVPRVPFHTLWIGVWMTEVRSAGFPHSDICGSMDICSSPQLFAAYHVFRRLLVPRHPPCALSSLTFRLYIALYLRCLFPGFCQVFGIFIPVF